VVVDAEREGVHEIRDRGEGLVRLEREVLRWSGRVEAASLSVRAEVAVDGRENIFADADGVGVGRCVGEALEDALLLQEGE
jgi:hypothetical protein